MCYQRLQRILTAVVLGITLLLFALGVNGNQTMFQVAVVLQTFVIVMLLIWAFTNFCPSLWFFKKIFPPCDWKE
jgi:sulfite exporter TauE/SafE